MKGKRNVSSNKKLFCTLVKQILDKTNTMIIVFLWKNKLPNYHYDILNDILVENIELHNKNFIVTEGAQSSTENVFNYFTIRPRKLREYAGNQNIIDLSKIYFAENNTELPIVELLCFVLPKKTFYLKSVKI